MKFLRNDKVKKKVLWFTTIIIILSFGVFGTAYLIAGNSGTGNTYAGSVFNQKIKIDDFSRQQKQVEIQAMMRYGDNYANVRNYLNLDGDTWNRLILLHEAERRNIKISDDEIIAAIGQYPYFQRNSQFDTLIYNDVLRYVLKIKPRDFEEGVRDNLKIARIFKEETKQAYVSEEEIFAEYKKENEKTKVKYVLIKPEDHIDPNQYDADKAYQYWENNKDQFVIPLSINLHYIEFPLPSDENPKVKDAALAEIDELLEPLRESKDLHAFAEEHNLAIKKTGFISKENPDLSLGWSFSLLNAVFQLEEKQIAGPFELDDRLVLVQLQEKKSSFMPEYEHIKDKVKTAYLTEAAKETARHKAQDYLKQIQNHPDPDFENAASSFHLDVEETPAFNRGQYLPKIGISKEFETAAFSLSAQERLSHVVELSNGFAILFLEKYTGVSREAMQEDKSALEARLLQEKQNELFNTFMTRLRLEAKIYDNISKLRRQQASEEQTAP